MNNNKQNGSNTYREQQILTASPARLVAMLYGKVITCLQQAIKAIENGDIQARYNANARAVEIIEHLSMTLDTDQGGQIAADLDRLYPFMIKHLINVDVKNDPEPAREVIAPYGRLGQARPPATPIPAGGADATRWPARRRMRLAARWPRRTSVRSIAARWAGRRC